MVSRDEVHKEYKELKKLYNNAVKNKIKVFLFGDKEVLTDYAKYLLEHLNNTYKFDKI